MGPKVKRRDWSLSLKAVHSQITSLTVGDPQGEKMPKVQMSEKNTVVSIYGKKGFTHRFGHDNTLFSSHSCFSCKSTLDFLIPSRFHNLKLKFAFLCTIFKRLFNGRT